MVWPSFLHAALLAGLAAVAIPVLIHLLLKTRQRRIQFSTLRFFDSSDREAVRSRKLRHWLLLCLRLLIIVLLVLAFARPFLDTNPASSAKGPPQIAVLLMDRSLSLTVRDPDGIRWERARAAARKILYSLPPEARVGLLACGGHADWQAHPGPATDTLKALDSLQPVPTHGDLGEALELAAQFFIQQNPKSSNTLYIITDCQRTSARRLPEVPFPPHVRVEWVPIGDIHTPNIALVELKLGAISGQTSSVYVANFDTQDQGPLTAHLMVDGQIVSSHTFTLPGGARSNLNFALPRLAPGWHTVAVRIDGEDPLTADNTRFQVVYVPPPLPVLLVEPRQSVKVYQEETFFLRSALDPNFGQTNSGTSGFEVERTSPEEMIRKLASGSRHGPYAVIMAPALKRWPPGAAAALASFVEKGGGLLLFAGDHANAIHYVAELGALLPGHWGPLQVALDLDWRIREWDKQSPVFAPFRQLNSGSPSVARFTKRLTLQPREGDQVLARFQDGQPAMLLRAVGQGQVLFFNGSADTQWHDWPRHKTFVPWLHSAARFLANRNRDAENVQMTNFWVGAVMDLTVEKEHREATLKWLLPDGAAHHLRPGDDGVLRGVEMPLPGVYSLRDSRGRELRRVAANIPPEESDLASFTPQEMQSRLTRSSESPHDTSTDLLGTGDNGRRELWRLLLLAGLLLMLTETIVGNRTVP